MVITEEKISEVIVSRRAISQLLGYKNDNYINELVNKHGAPRSAHDQYPLAEFIQWFMNYKEEEAARRIRKIAEEKPTDLLARKSAELKDLQIKEKSGELVDFNRVKESWLQEISIIISNIDGFAVKVAPLLTGIQDIKEIQTILDGEINKVKERIGSSELHTS